MRRRSHSQIWASLFEEQQRKRQVAKQRQKENDKRCRDDLRMEIRRGMMDKVARVGRE